MLAYPLALTALLAGSAAAVPRSTRQEFIRAMRQQKNLDPKILSNAAKSSALRKTILEEATFVPPERKLDEAEAEADAESNANQNQNQQYYYSQNYIQGTDDAYSFNTDADWQNNWGFDASQYSLSYERCSTVKHFDVEKAAQEDATSPFRTQHFAVLRLCPTKSCDRPDWYLEVEEDGEVAEVEPEDNGEVYGANGRGCSSNYGTFILDAGRYLQLMAEYEDTQFDMYCNYCEHYMQKMYEKWVNNGGQYRHLEFEEFKNHPDLERMLGGYDAEWYSCSVYANACGGDWRQDDYADFLECNEVQKNNGMVAYTQATCAEDGEAITIGLYSDDSCSEDITSKVNIANWIGEQLDEDEMARYYKRINSGMAELIETYGGTTSVDPESVCLPCSVEVRYSCVKIFCFVPCFIILTLSFFYYLQNQAWFLADDDVTQQAQKNQQEGAYQYSHASQGEIADICDAVFMQSARCDKTLSKWWQRKRDANYAESNALQDLSCEFIDNMRMGKYDTEGNVIMDANRLYNEDGAQGINGNLYVQEYGQGLAEVSPMQIFFLVLTISACAILAAWSSTLHKSLTKGGLKWKPNRGVGAEEDEIARQSSGILVGRSQSNHSSYYMS